MALAKELSRPGSPNSNLCISLIHKWGLKKRFFEKKNKYGQMEKKKFCEDCCFKMINEITSIFEYKKFKEDVHVCALKFNCELCDHCEQFKNSVFYYIYFFKYRSMPEILSKINYHQPIIQIQKIWRGKLARMRKKRLEEWEINTYLLKKDESNKKMEIFEIFSKDCYLDSLYDTP